MSFYLTLPSDSSMNYFPNNKISNYVTRLPTHIDLQGDWEVGVVECIYPHTWNNVPVDTTYRIDLSVDKDVLENNLPTALNHKPHFNKDVSKMKLIKVTPGYAKTPADLIKAVVGVTDISNKVSLVYNGHSRKVKVTSKKGTRLVMSRGLADMLGFISEEVTPIRPCPAGSTYHMEAIRHHKECSIEKEMAKQNMFMVETKEGNYIADAPRVADVHLDFRLFYLYCDIVEPQIVGDVYAPLMRIITVRGQDGDVIHEYYERPQYIPLMQKNFQTIEMVIRTHSGKLVPFEGGQLIVKLHFRQKFLR